MAFIYYAISFHLRIIRLQLYILSAICGGMFFLMMVFWASFAILFSTMLYRSFIVSIICLICYSFSLSPELLLSHLLLINRFPVLVPCNHRSAHQHPLPSRQPITGFQNNDSKSCLLWPLFAKVTRNRQILIVDYQQLINNRLQNASAGHITKKTDPQLSIGLSL